MSQPAKAQEPSMEEILASIRRIIADDDSNKPAAPAAVVPSAPPAAVPQPAAVPPPVAATQPPMNQNDIDAMLAGLDAPPGHDAGDREDILELTESMAAPEPAPTAFGPSFQTIDGQPDVVFSDAPAPEPAPRAAEPALRPVDETRRAYTEPPMQERPLLSTSATAAVGSAFNSLAQTVLVDNARTLEDLVREMLRPMLKAWLDDNLPGMVERMVRAEIERVSRSR